jgi:hypothetical protein
MDDIEAHGHDGVNSTNRKPRDDVLGYLFGKTHGSALKPLVHSLLLLVLGVARE